jgi:hypothetical protein
MRVHHRLGFGEGRIDIAMKRHSLDGRQRQSTAPSSDISTMSSAVSAAMFCPTGVIRKPSRERTLTLPEAALIQAAMHAFARSSDASESRKLAAHKVDFFMLAAPFRKQRRQRGHGWPRRRRAR